MFVTVGLGLKPTPNNPLYSFCIKITDFGVLKGDSKKTPLRCTEIKPVHSLYKIQNNL